MSTTETPRAVRKLAAIVVADVVGYSRQMGADDVGTLGRVRSVRTEILDPLMREHGGRIVKLMGDGILAEFASAVSATAWAVGVQQALAKRNESVAEADVMLLRIGVNIGDVILEDDDIFGDGVNVAARLEPLAPKGGVCISAAVHDHVAGKVGVEFVARGERTLKNIARPVAIWCWSTQPLEEETVVATVREKGRKPSVCVRPFDVAGGSGDATLLSAAVYDATVLALSNLSGITLLADPGGADFLASATIQAVGTRYRATVRLVDNSTGQQFWSDRFDGDLSEIFEAQDDLALRISTALRYSIYDRQVQETERIPVSERTSEMIFARIGRTLAGGFRSEWPDAGPALDTILAADPSDAGAHAMKACWHLYEVFYGWRELAAEDRSAAIKEARQAVRCNEQNDFARLTMALVHIYAENDPQRALRECERALELSPYFAMGRYGQGLAQLFGGDAERGFTNCVAAAQASSRNVIHHRMLQGAALAAFLCERSAEAFEIATRADHLQRDVAPTLLILAAAAASAGRANEAAAAVGQLLQQFPDFTLSEMRRWPFHRDADNERFVAALRSSGLPD
ncbi:MAG TPA: adenylate/guanylate cyclase domain-containing protein [Candidatus Limnocylindrales bacterium]|nr:adenylate/guanylate cyclase domain-containing protein [Candidatus Limnocylindrales bacterium]